MDVACNKLISLFDYFSWLLASGIRFSYVGQDTQTLVILGSPQILTRKWCVGEMVTGRSQNVHTVLLTFPGFAKPDESYLDDLDGLRKN